MTKTPPAPMVRATPQEIAAGAWIIADHRVPLVPNIGIILGEHSALVVDTGLGPKNGQAVLEAAQRLAGGRRLILTLTHFHPEHGFGAQAFKGKSHILYNRSQATELAAKGKPYLDMFRGMSPEIAEALDGTKLVEADELYDGNRHVIDLGGRKAELLNWGTAHTQGDQVVWLPDERILFTGDLAEERIFPIFPWFPPDDVAIDAAGWLRALDSMVSLSPTTVVPGHGGIGNVDIVQGVARYILDVAARVKRGQTPDEVSAAMQAAHPDWEAPEWIGFAVQYFQDRPL